MLAILYLFYYYITLQHANFRDTISMISDDTGGALWLGEHHNSKRDHDLQADLIRTIYETRQTKAQSNRKSSSTNTPSPHPMAVGLEQVQIKFQSVLDDYIAGRITSEDMRRDVDWERRWTWPFEYYLPVFEVARGLQIPLLALNVNSEDLAEVEKSGLPGLSRKRLRTYIKDP